MVVVYRGPATGGHILPAPYWHPPIFVSSYSSHLRGQRRSPVNAILFVAFARGSPGRGGGSRRDRAWADQAPNSRLRHARTVLTYDPVAMSENDLPLRTSGNRQMISGPRNLGSLASREEVSPAFSNVRDCEDHAGSFTAIQQARITPESHPDEHRCGRVDAKGKPLASLFDPVGKPASIVSRVFGDAAVARHGNEMRTNRRCGQATGRRSRTDAGERGANPPASFLVMLVRLRRGL